MIIGNSKKRQQIEQLAMANQLPHALLLSGPKGTGKYRFLKHLSHLLLQNAHAVPPALVQVDALYIDGQNKIEDIQSSTFDQSHRKKEKKKTDTIGVDDIESFTRHLFETTESAYKIVLIRDIERFTLPAGNKFLKILEEPPEKTMFFLTTSKEYTILPTIVSRVRKETFSLASPQELAEHFTPNIGDEQKKIILDLSAGRCEEFFALQQSEQYLKQQQAQWQEYAALLTITPPEAFAKAEKMAKDSTESIVSFLEGYLLLLQREVRQALATKNEKKASAVSKKIKRCVQSIAELTSNANKRLTLESLFLV